MIDLEALESNIKKNNLKNVYIFTGLDELLIKEGIDNIINSSLDESFRELNLIKLDGLTVEFSNIRDNCETMPFMSDKKVVLVYRADFLKDKTDASGKALYNDIKSYIKDVPDHCVLIMYYLLNDKRDRAEKNSKLKTLGNSAEIVKADKLRGEKLYKKVKEIFDEKHTDIGRVELRYFCELVDNNFTVIEREVEKLSSYCNGKNITKEDIVKLLPKREDEDVFDLVEFLSIKKPEKAIDLMNELIMKGEAITKILSLVENQMNMLLKVKILIDEKKSKDQIAKEIGRPSFVAEKLINQSRKFSYGAIQFAMKRCVETEKILKSSSNDKKMEMELLFLDISLKK